MALASNLTPDSAVDEYILAFPALRALDGEVPFFRLFLTGVAKCLLQQANWGLNFLAQFPSAVS